MDDLLKSSIVLGLFYVVAEIGKAYAAGWLADAAKDHRQGLKEPARKARVRAWGIQIFFTLLMLPGLYWFGSLLWRGWQADADSMGGLLVKLAILSAVSAVAGAELLRSIYRNWRSFLYAQRTGRPMLSAEARLRELEAVVERMKARPDAEP